MSKKPANSGQEVEGSMSIDEKHNKSHTVGAREATALPSDEESQSLPPDDDSTVTQKKKRKNHRGGKKKSASSTKPYEIKPSAEKGLGVFATQDIKRGTRIMCETPLMHLKAAYDDVYEAFKKLSPQNQAVFLSLQVNPSPGFDWKSGPEIFAHFNAMLKPEGFTKEKELKVLSIHQTNAFKAPEGWDYKYTHATVVCADASWLDHSCIPNVYHAWNNNLGALTVHAVRDIAVGEELLINYRLAWQAGYTMRRHLLGRWNVNCTCVLCEAPASFRAVSDQRRDRWLKLDSTLAIDFQNPIDIPFRTEKKGADIKGGLDSTREYIVLLEAEGIVGMGYARKYYEAANFASLLGKSKVACEWRKKASEIASVCCGRDLEGYEAEQEGLRKFLALHEAKKAIKT
ncbi:MAG: hypothetical protein Q9218_007450 [Villophora microphyllina]